MASISVTRKSIEEKGGVVILPASEYRRLIAATVPTHYLTGKHARDLDKLWSEGMREHKAGKTRKIKSLADLD